MSEVRFPGLSRSADKSTERARNEFVPRLPSSAGGGFDYSIFLVGREPTPATDPFEAINNAILGPCINELFRLTFERFYREIFAALREAAARTGCSEAEGEERAGAGQGEARAPERAI